MIVRGSTQEDLLIEQMSGHCYGWTVFRYIEVMHHFDAEMSYIVAEEVSAYTKKMKKNNTPMYVTNVVSKVSNAVFKVILEREGLLEKVKKHMDLSQFKMEGGAIRLLMKTYKIPSKGRTVMEIIEDYMRYIVDWSLIEVKKYHYYDLE